MVIGEALRVNQVRAEFQQAVLEALRLRDAAERRDFLALEQVEIVALAGEDVLEVKGLVDTLDDAGGGIVLRDAGTKAGGVAVALGDEDGARAREVRTRFAQGAARKKILVAERRLAIDEHDVAPPTGELPVLEAIVEQERVAAELLNRVAAALHAVLVHQHDHVLEIRREHVGLVTGGFGIEQQRFAVRDDARRRGVRAQENAVEQALGKRRRL